MSIRHPRAFLSFALASMLLAGCVKTGSVNVTQPVDAKVKSYDSIVVSAASTQADLEKYMPKLQESIAQGLQKEKVFAQASAGGTASQGAVTLRMKVAKKAEGSKLARTMNLGGEVEVEVDCELVDESTQTTLARFVAKGNSARKSKTSVNGFDTSIADDLDGRAVRAAGEQIVTFLGENTK